MGVDVFSVLAAKLKMDSQNSEWFQLGQLLVLGMARQDDEFKELLGRVPLEKVSKEPVCKSTLLQDFARAGRAFAVTALLQYGVDPEAVTENNECSPEILAWKNNHLEVLVEMNKFKELKSCIMESDLGREVQRREERGWKKKMEEKQDSIVATLNQLVSLNRGNSEDKPDHNLFNLLLSVSAAFLFGFFSCFLLLATHLH